MLLWICFVVNVINIKPGAAWGCAQHSVPGDAWVPQQVSQSTMLRQQFLSLIAISSIIMAGWRNTLPLLTIAIFSAVVALVKSFCRRGLMTRWANEWTLLLLFSPTDNVDRGSTSRLKGDQFTRNPWSDSEWTQHERITVLRTDKFWKITDTSGCSDN